MAGVILKSPYIKCGGNRSASGYLSYIGTRENVELIPDDRPPTRKQEQLIAKLVKDFPATKKLDAYADYMDQPTKFKASGLITRALEENWDAVARSEQYMKYIATRPRAERFGDHGLFGDEDKVSLEKTMAELDSYTGNVWTHIISLKREDAARLGFDNAKAWRELLRANRNVIADAMQIPAKNFRWYAAFHDEGDHTHVHMMAWSTQPGQAHLDTDGIREIRSALTNQIFQEEMLHLYEQKSESRDELVRQLRSEMLQLAHKMQNSICDHPEVEQLMQELVVQLGTVSGKRSYGYLPKKQKAIVDRIVDAMTELPSVSACYDRWLELQGKVESYYHDHSMERKPLSQQKEFTAVKNAVIKEAERIRLERISFEDKGIGALDEPEEFQYSTYAYDDVRNVIRDESLSMDERRKALEELYSMAEEDDVHAQYLLGKLYRDGPLLIPDTSEAAYWFDRAARQGVVEAQYALGKMYLSDDIEVRDTDLGIQWLAYAAQNGSDYAAYRLGKEYLKGTPVERDPAKAVAYFRQAAENGNRYAQYMLGKLYLDGKEVPYSKEKALCWLGEAAEQGHRYAAYFLDRQEELALPSVMLAATSLLYHMSRIFRDNSLLQSGSSDLRIDRKRMKRLQEKRKAMGHKPNDHPDYRGPSMSM